VVQFSILFVVVASMAMDTSALLDLLAALKHIDVGDRVRTATEHVYRELINTEATAVISAGPPHSAPCRATGPATRR
jgi:hypothetical protein